MGIKPHGSTANRLALTAIGPAKVLVHLVPNALHLVRRESLVAWRWRQTNGLVSVYEIVGPSNDGMSPSASTPTNEGMN